MSAQGYTFSSVANEKKRRTWATSEPFTPSLSELLLRKTQSRRGLTEPPDLHRGVERIFLRYMPLVPEGLLGAQKIAFVEWKTERRAMPAVNHWMVWTGGRAVSWGFTW